MAERFLIASGTSKYAALTGMDRPALDQAVQSVVQLFTSLRYKRVLDAVGANPSSADLKKRLNRWLGDPQRQPSDWVVFYYTGHGELDSANQFYLLTADSETGDRANTQISMQQIAAMLLDTDAEGRNRRVRRMLFIIDACNAGAGAATITTNLFASFFSQPRDITIGIVAAAFPNQEAFAGALARALTEAIEDEAVGGTKQEFLFFDGDLMPAIRRRLRGQKALYTAIQSEDAPQFIPNPRYRPEAVSPIGGAAGDRTILTGFTGRTAALDRVCGWLDSTGDQRTTLVTGSPGSGKSALLLKAVSLGGPKFSSRVSARKPSAGLALHARGKTSSDVLGSLSQALNVPTSWPDVSAALSSRKKPFYLAIDDVDEAAEPDAIARLLRPMDDMPGVKLLVGAGARYAPKLGATHTINLDLPRYRKISDVQNYIESRLAASKNKTYGRRRVTSAVSRMAASKVRSNFLAADLLANDLIRYPAEETARVLRSRGTATPLDLFRAALKRLGDEEGRARDLLRPLAWAFGVGLPWSNIWAPLADALSTRDTQYSDDDIRWLFRETGAFVLEALDQDRSCYRLLHQPLADDLRAADMKRTKAIHYGFVDVLTASVPTRENAESPDWPSAHPYVLTHLPEHAARCGRLEAFLRDPLFVLSVNTSRLMRVTHSVKDRRVLKIVASFRDCAERIEKGPVAAAATCLQRAATRRGAAEFAQAVAELGERK